MTLAARMSPTRAQILVVLAAHRFQFANLAWRCSCGNWVTSGKTADRAESAWRLHMATHLELALAATQPGESS
jgi:hypothetical protein